MFSLALLGVGACACGGTNNTATKSPAGPGAQEIVPGNYSEGAHVEPEAGQDGTTSPPPLGQATAKDTRVVGADMDPNSLVNIEIQSWEGQLSRDEVAEQLKAHAITFKECLDSPSLPDHALLSVSGAVDARGTFTFQSLHYIAGLSGLTTDVDASDCMSKALSAFRLTFRINGRLVALTPGPLHFRVSDKEAQGSMLGAWGPGVKPSGLDAHSPQAAANTKNEIKLVIRAALPAIRSCYERELATNPSLHGTLNTTLQISPSGAVTSASASGMNAELATCVEPILKGLQFSKPKSGGFVNVSYPFTFGPSEASTTPPAKP